MEQEQPRMYRTTNNINFLHGYFYQFTVVAYIVWAYRKFSNLEFAMEAEEFRFLQNIVLHNKKTDEYISWQIKHSKNAENFVTIDLQKCYQKYRDMLPDMKKKCKYLILFCNTTFIFTNGLQEIGSTYDRRLVENATDICKDIPHVDFQDRVTVYKFNTKDTRIQSLNPEDERDSDSLTDFFSKLLLVVHQTDDMLEEKLKKEMKEEFEQVDCAFTKYIYSFAKTICSLERTEEWRRTDAYTAEILEQFKSIEKNATKDIQEDLAKIKIEPA